MDKVTHLRNYASYLKFVQNELDKLFEKQNSFGEFVNMLRNYGNFIGISGYGEQLNFIHLNQTMILLVFE